MAIRTFSQIAQSMQDNIRLRQPALDTKPGSVARDLFIDNTADQIATVYRDMSLIIKTQSLLSSTGQILDQFGSNYNILRDPGKRAAGNAILTFNNLINNISINSGTTVTAKTGIVFRITSNILISAATKGLYSSYASSIATQLHIAGISDQYAVQVPIEAINIGTNGNIPVYSLVKTSIPGITNVTNIAITSGGTNAQGDSQYRNQILAGLTGSSAGTSRGYQNALALVSGIQSSYIAIPGDPILTRDGTVVERNADGSLFVLTPGIGGKVDIWLQGTNFINITESYVFHDISGTGDVTSSLNSHIFGQTTNTSTLTPAERRKLFINGGQLPLQPVDSILSLSGSVSGANFIQGINYKLVKDTNPETANTAFALDNIVFLQNFLSINGENVAKGNSNSVDRLVFNGIKSINNVKQDIIVTNDLANLNSSDHTQIIINHNPLTTVLRATNLTTGERYTITDQNIDSNTGLNNTGAITISGSILPSAQDLIQVDYTWNFNFDATTDYFVPHETSIITTGIDWGKSNYISMENSPLMRNNGRYNLYISRNIDRVYNAFYCDTQVVNVQQALPTDNLSIGRLRMRTVHGFGQSSINSQINTVDLRQITISTGSGPVLYFVFPGTTLVSSGITTGDILHISGDTAVSPRTGTYTIAAVIDEPTLQIQPTSPALIAETGDCNIQINNSADTTTLLSALVSNVATIAENSNNITNVVSVKDEITGVELYATELGGTFSGNTIYLATDVPQAVVGESVIAYFNAHEVYNISKNNGSINNSTIILSTDDVLSFNSVLQPLDDIFNNVNIKPIFVNYVASDVDVVVRTPIFSMPFIGSSATSTLVDKTNTLLTSRQPIELINGNNIRSGASYLSFIVDGAFSSGGTFALRGSGWFKVIADIPVSQNNVNGSFDLAAVITEKIGNVSTNYLVAKLTSVLINDGISTQQLSLRGYAISNNIYDMGIATMVTSMNTTTINLAPILPQNGLTALTIGSTLTITFYVLAQNVSETIQFTNGRGTLYTKYKYARVDRVDLISGFLNPSNSTISGNLRITRVSQPTTSSTYSSDYSYFGPVENESLNVQYRYNNVIQDATTAIESVRTLTADVLTRLSFPIAVNVSVNVILNDQAINQSAQIIDQAISAVNNLITSQAAGSTLDYSACLRVVTAISGVQGADVLVFDYVDSNFKGQANRKSIKADANQYFSVGIINITSGTR
jgi:hypothetical protein